MYRKVNFLLPNDTKKNIKKVVIDKFYLLHSNTVKDYFKVTNKYIEEFGSKYNSKKKIN